MKKKIFLFTLLLLTTFINAQDSKAQWELVVKDGQDKVYLDTKGISSFASEDIYVWTMTEHATPIVIESIEHKIYKTNTYYLFNTRLNKYSILYIIYYDFSGNVLASYDYGRNTKVESYQYNYPVFKNSTEEKILQKCVEIIKKKAENK
jgi:hypothetical protein